MNIHLQKQVQRWCVHLVFCVSFIYFFYTNCNLRPAAKSVYYPYYYKEFITGIIALVVIYLNYLLLFPKFYACRKYKTYWLLTLCSIVISGCLEMLLVFPEVKVVYLRSQCTTAELTKYMFYDTVQITLRNGGWVFFSIVLNEILRVQQQEKSRENVLRKQYDFLDVRDLKYKDGFINVKDIYYCEQEENIVTIHTINQEKYFRYCSLKRMEELLGCDEFTRISRSVIVSNKFIGKYGNGQLELRKINKSPAAMNFPIGENYEDRLREQLKATINNEIALNAKKEKANQRGKRKKDFIPKTKTTLEEFEHNPKILAVYLHIKKNPNCNVNNISYGCRMPHGTVRRYITFLLDKQLVQHNGSKRYGGYTIVKRDPLAEE